MGFNISVVTKDYEKQHPTWDSIRNGNDYDFMFFFDSKDKIEPDWNVYSGVFRPTNLDNIKEKVEKSNFENKDRYMFLISIFENDHDKEWWIDFS